MADSLDGDVFQLGFCNSDRKRGNSKELDVLFTVEVKPGLRAGEISHGRFPNQCQGICNFDLVQWPPT